MKIIVLGNGQSRRNIDINLLKQQGKVYACNAAYRDFMPDVLVAIDQVMAQEIVKNQIHKHIPVYTREIYKLESCKPYKCLLSSGTTALKIASEQNPSEIIILGMDFSSNDGLVNNIYAGTTNYRDYDKAQPPMTPWIYEFVDIINSNPGIKYTRLIDSNCLQLLLGANYEERVLFDRI